MTYSQIVLSLNPVGYWSFDGNTAADSSGHNYHGTPVGGGIVYDTDNAIGGGKSLSSEQ